MPSRAKVEGSGVAVEPGEDLDAEGPVPWRADYERGPSRVSGSANSYLRFAGKENVSVGKGLSAGQAVVRVPAGSWVGGTK